MSSGEHPWIGKRVVSDRAGAARLVESPIVLHATDFAPPAAPLNVSDPTPATDIRFVEMPVGWGGEPHPTPRKQFMIVLAGEIDAEFGDGVHTRLMPGGMLLLEDTSGRGHTFSVVGDRAALIAMVAVDI